MIDPSIPKGFVMIHTATHSICIRISYIMSIAAACGENDKIYITTADGESYKVAYNFEDFLNTILESMDDNYISRVS